MSYKTAFLDIMREYESDRNRAEALLRNRQEEVYGKLPRVKEIDRELSMAGISAARQILSDGGKQQTLLAKLRRDSSKLKSEKDKLLAENGVSKGYFTDIYRCAKCKDTGYAGTTERCLCLKQRIVDKYYDLSNIKSVLETENFETFDINLYSETVDPKSGISPRRNMELIYQSALSFVDTFSGPFQNLLYYGDSGLGKTFLCNCIAKELLDEGRTVLYVTAPRLFKLVEDHRFNRDGSAEPDYAIDAASDVDLLILDDLGTEFSTIVTSAALFDIINQRLLAKKPTVISTNFSVPELESQYSDRIISRFVGHYKMSKFFGEDIRVKRKHGG